jgi:hypothetical protein
VKEQRNRHRVKRWIKKSWHAVARRRAEETGAYEPVRWRVGSDEFRQELLAQVSELATPKDGGKEIRRTALAKAERIAQEELKVLGWSTQDL